MTHFTTTLEISSIVKEDLNSYFSSGAIDDIMFPKWIEWAMKDFKKSAYEIKYMALPLENYTVPLPEDFDSVKELWACGHVGRAEFENFTSLYYQTDCRITPIDDPCNECFDACSGEYPAKDERYRVTHKVTGVTELNYYVTHLLTPGNQNAVSYCGTGCSNFKANSADTFDIRDCKVITNYPDGLLHLTYYAKNIDEDGNILIPDNNYIKEYLVLHLKYKVFEKLSNSVNDESLKQIFSKMQYYEQKALEAKITAKVEMKKWDKYTIIKQVKKRRNRFSNYRRSLY